MTSDIGRRFSHALGVVPVTKSNSRHPVRVRGLVTSVRKPPPLVVCTPLNSRVYTPRQVYLRGCTYAAGMHSFVICTPPYAQQVYVILIVHMGV